MQNRTDLKKLTTEAKQLFRRLGESQSGIQSAFENDVDIAWQFGKYLNRLKPRVGHGSWEKWRKDTFPGLDDRRAQRCQALDSENLNASNWTHLSKESVRKYRHIYLIVKDRPKLKGDGRFPRPSHHSSVVNECNKLMQRIKTGQYKPDEVQLLRDFRAFFGWLSELYARTTPT